jgi:hypothetical protein
MSLHLLLSNHNAHLGACSIFANPQRDSLAILDRCEWGHDDYSLKVENLPKAPVKPGQLELNL